MKTEQPLALKLADELEMWGAANDAAELRRQHAENENLRLRLSLARYALFMLVKTDKLDPWQCDLYDRAMLDNIALAREGEKT